MLEVQEAVKRAQIEVDGGVVVCRGRPAHCRDSIGGARELRPPVVRLRGRWRARRAQSCKLTVHPSAGLCIHLRDCEEVRRRRTKLQVLKLCIRLCGSLTTAHNVAPQELRLGRCVVWKQRIEVLGGLHGQSWLRLSAGRARARAHNLNFNKLRRHNLSPAAGRGLLRFVKILFL